MQLMINDGDKIFPIAIQGLSVTELKPGDLFVVKTKVGPDQEFQQQVIKFFQELLPEGIQVVVVDDNLSFGSVSMKDKDPG